MRFLLLSSTRKNRMIKKQKAIACTIEDVASNGSICTYTRVAHLRSRLGLLRPCNDFIRHRFAAAAAAAAAAKLPVDVVTHTRRPRVCRRRPHRAGIYSRRRVLTEPRANKPGRPIDNQWRTQGGIKEVIPPNYQNWTSQLMQNMLLI